MITDRFPGIRRAVLELAYANNAIGNPSLGGQTELQALEKADEVLGADGVDENDLRTVDAWLQTLTKDEMGLVCDGEGSEIGDFMRARGAPEKTDGLLEDLFENL